jgi:hypothetical protein
MILANSFNRQKINFHFLCRQSQPTLKIHIFYVSCLRRPIQKIEPKLKTTGAAGSLPVVILILSFLFSLLSFLFSHYVLSLLSLLSWRGGRTQARERQQQWRLAARAG